MRMRRGPLSRARGPSNIASSMQGSNASSSARRRPCTVPRQRKKSIARLHEQALAAFVPGRIERDVEPVGQPGQRLRRRGARIEQRLHVDDAVLDLGQRALDVGEPALEEGRPSRLRDTPPAGSAADTRSAATTRAARAGAAWPMPLALRSRSCSCRIAAVRVLQQQLPGADAALAPRRTHRFAAQPRQLGAVRAQAAAPAPAASRRSPARRRRTGESVPSASPSRSSPARLQISTAVSAGTQASSSSGPRSCRSRRCRTPA